MTDRVGVGNLHVAKVLYDFINNEALPGTGLDADTFWAGADKVISDLAPKTRNCLPAATICRRRSTGGIASGSSGASIPRNTAHSSPRSVTSCRSRRTSRSRLQVSIPNRIHGRAAVGGADLNARFALNAANARWGSLYDALFTAPTSSRRTTGGKGSRIQQGPRRQGDCLRPEVPGRRRSLASGSFSQATALRVVDGQLGVPFAGGVDTGLADPAKFVGTQAMRTLRDRSCLVNHGLHVEILIDRESLIGSTDAAGIKDVVLESAVTTIMEFEDSVAAVDAGGQSCRLPKLVGAQPR